MTKPRKEIRPICYFCHAFAGARGKVAEVLRQEFGEDCMTILSENKSIEHGRGDIDLQNNPAVRSWESPVSAKLISFILNHRYIHLWCDLAKFVRPIIETGEKMLVHKYDITSMRGGNDSNEKFVAEAENVETVYINENHQKYMLEKYDIDPEKTHVIHNFTPLAWVPEIPKPERKISPSIVYHGGLVSEQATGVPYRWMVNVFKALADGGIDVHVYPAMPINERMLDVYSYPGVFLHHKVPHSQLHQEIAQYDVGLVGYRTDISPEMLYYARHSLPNKATDYMFAGIPTLALNGGYMEKWVKNWGVCVENETQLVEGWNEAMGMEIDFDHWRGIYNMEASKPELLALYEKIRRDV